MHDTISLVWSGLVWSGDYYLCCRSLWYIVTDPPCHAPAYGPDLLLQICGIVPSSEGFPTPTAGQGREGKRKTRHDTTRTALQAVRSSSGRPSPVSRRAPGKIRP